MARSTPSVRTPHTPQPSLRRLIEGNRRFAAGVRSVEPMLSAMNRRQLAESGQTPLATIITCSDSRLPAETVFDCGLGDLFVVRVAGAVLNEDVVASAEYATLALGVPLIVVMGHSRCGAVGAAVEGSAATPSIDALLAKLKPSVQAARSGSGLAGDALVQAAVERSVRDAVDALPKASPALGALRAEGRLALCGAVYDLATGVADFGTPSRGASWEALVHAALGQATAVPGFLS